jgi:hypothetical protein
MSARANVQLCTLFGTGGGGDLHPFAVFVLVKHARARAITHTGDLNASRITRRKHAHKCEQQAKNAQNSFHMFSSLDAPKLTILYFIFYIITKKWFCKAEMKILFLSSPF